MKRTILWILHVLGWVAFVPFAVLFVLLLIDALVGGIDTPDGPIPLIEVLASCVVLLGFAVPGLVVMSVTRGPLQRMKRPKAQLRGFEPVMSRER